MPMKKLVGLLGAAYVLGVATPLLMLFGAGRLGRQTPSFLIQLAAVVGLVLVAAALVWLLGGSRRQPPAVSSVRAGVRAPSVAAAGAAAPVGARAAAACLSDEDLPTVGEWWHGTPDGPLGTTLSTVPDFDPASDPLLRDGDATGPA